MSMDPDQPSNQGGMATNEADAQCTNTKERIKMIDFSNLQFVGRNTERGQLTKAYQDMLKQSTSRDSSKEQDVTTAAVPATVPAALIWGQSGTGKSCLVKHFIDNMVCDDPDETQLEGAATTATAASSFSSSSSSISDKRTLPSRNRQLPRIPTRRCYCARGKHDEHTGASDPFSAITEALRHFASTLQSEPQQEITRIRKCVQATLGDEATAIISMVPALSILFHPTEIGAKVMRNEQSDTDSESSSSQQQQQHPIQKTREVRSSAVAENSWRRLQYTFVTFIKAVASAERPFVLFLDDLQWASQVTTELLSTLLLDAGLRYFFFIGAIRQEEGISGGQVADSAPLSTMLHDLQDKQYCVMLNIQLSNLNPFQLAELLSEILHEHAAPTDSSGQLMQLSRWLHSRTHGNILFTIQALEQMHRAGRFDYDTTHSRWSWSWGQPRPCQSGSRLGSVASQPATTAVVSNSGGTDTNNIIQINNINNSNNTSGSDSNGEDGDDNDNDKSTFELSASVVDVIANKLLLLKPQIRTTIVLASYIRSSFDLDTLQVVMNCVSQHHEYCKTNDFAFYNNSAEIKTNTPISKNESTTMGKSRRSSNRIPSLESLLEKAVLEGLLNNTIGDITYRFAHDRIKEAAQGLIPMTMVDHDSHLGHQRTSTPGDDASQSPLNNREQLKHLVGMSLWQHCQAKEISGSLEDHGLLFVAADHLNSIPCTDDAFSTTMNLTAGKKALGLAAAMTASEYLDQADIALRSQQRKSGSTRADIWRDNYELTLEVYRFRIDAKLVLGDYDEGYSLGDTLLANARCTDDKLHTLLSMASAMGAQHRDVESLALSKQGLQLLGLYPRKWHTFHAMLGMINLKRFFQANSDKDVLDLPVNTNSKVLAGMRSIAQIIIRSFLLKDQVSMAVAVAKMVQLSMEHGICDGTAFAISGFGMISAFQSDQRTAMRCVGLSRKLLDRFNNKRLYGWVNFYNVFFVEIWCRPIELCLARLKKAYTSALEVGEFEVAILCWFGSLATSFFDSRSLGPLVQTGEDILNHKVLFKVDTLGSFPAQFVMTIKRLVGQLPLDWDEAERFTSMTINQTNRYAVVGGAWSRLHIAVYFSKYELAEKLWKMLLKAGADDAYTMMTTFLFAGGVMAAGRHRQTRQKKYLKILKNCRNKLKRMSIQNGRNCLHRSLILQAEQLALKLSSQQHHAVTTMYDTAIAVSLEGNRIQEAALCCELAGNYLLSANKPSKTSAIVHYFTRAFRLYHEWGGAAKARHVEARRGRYVDNSTLAENTRHSRNSHNPHGRPLNNSVRTRSSEGAISTLPHAGSSLSFGCPSTFRSAGQGLMPTATVRPVCVIGGASNNSKADSGSKTTAESPTSSSGAKNLINTSEAGVDGGDDVSILTQDH